jgi:hypothetical protein
MLTVRTGPPPRREGVGGWVRPPHIYFGKIDLALPELSPYTHPIPSPETPNPGNPKMPAEATPHELLRENLDMVLQARAKSLSLETRTALIDYILDPKASIRIKGIMEVAGVSKPTAMKYRNFLLATLENPPTEVGLGRVDRPTDRSLDYVRDVVRSTMTKEYVPEEQRELTSDDVVSIMDQTIRRLHADKAPGTAIKAMLEMKIKFQEIESKRSERTIDPHKVLGSKGLAGLMPILTGRFGQFLRHRREVPTFWNSAAATVLDCLIADIEKDIPIDPALAGTVSSFQTRLSAFQAGEPKPEPGLDTPIEPSDSATRVKVEDIDPPIVMTPDQLDQFRADHNIEPEEEKEIDLPTPASPFQGQVTKDDGSISL